MRNGLLSRLSYANVMATVAVFLALGGSAYALSGIPDSGGVYHGCVASSGALRVVSKASSCHKAKTVTRGTRRVHIPGESAIAWNQQGRPGSNGKNGTNGSPAASMLTGLSPEGCAFVSPSGTTTTPCSGTVSSVAMLSPAATIVARDLSVSSDHSFSGTETITLTVNGADTALSCQMVDTGPCQDTTHAVTIPPGSTIAIHYQLTNGSGGQVGGIIRFGWRATTP